MKKVLSTFEKRVKKNTNEYDKVYNKLNNALKELDIYFDFLENKLSIDNNLESFLRLLVNQSYNFNIDSYYLDDYDIQYYYLNILDLFKNKKNFETKDIYSMVKELEIYDINKNIQKYIKKWLKIENIDKYIIICHNSNYNSISFYGSYRLKKEFNKELKRIDKEFKKIELENSFDNN